MWELFQTSVLLIVPCIVFMNMKIYTYKQKKKKKKNKTKSDWALLQNIYKTVDYHGKYTYVIHLLKAFL